MPSRSTVLAVAILVAIGLGFALVPASAQQIHRHGFAGKQTMLLRGDANVRVDEKDHEISNLSFKSQPSSEHIQIVTEAGVGDSPHVNYYYETPKAPVSPVLSASVWVKATKPGTQLRARVVLPKEPDPARPEAFLTMHIIGTTYEKTRSWEKLTLDDISGLIGKHLPALQAKIGRNINTAEAYIDRLVLNVYSGPGTVDVWIDDLDIGPVKAEEKADKGGANVPGLPAKKGESAVIRTRQVQQRGGQLLVEGKPYFFRAIRHSGTPLHVLRSAGFDSLWLPGDAAPELIDEAAREGWFVIPSAPKYEMVAAGNAGLSAFDTFLRKFGNSDVLFWDLGGQITEEQQDRIFRTVAEVRRGDKKRPIGGDLWDGFNSYARSIDMVGAHRWPLFTSLELPRYREWLEQRRKLTGGQPVFWTWVQNHLPDWYAASLVSRPVEKGANPALALDDPAGPHPEQVRQLAYISVACGARGLGFWSDRYLADSMQGRDRLQGIALLNTELDLISPVLMSAGTIGDSKNVWLNTSNPNVKAALITGQKGTLLLPIWMGPGDQYVPAQGAVMNLKIIVPTIAEGHDPWLITPAGPECLRHRTTRGPKGTEITIDEFDMVAPIVFTDDQGANGIVVWWQDHARRYGRLAARWALDQAWVEYEKVRIVHTKLVAMGVPIRGADRLFEETQRYYAEAQKSFANEQYKDSYRDAARALRPLRVIMRDHWRLATEGLDVPAASPYAVSFFTLPQHWDLAREVQSSRPSPSVLPFGNFEVASDLPPEGISIDRLPGWSARTGSLPSDKVVVAAGVVTAEKLDDRPMPRQHKKEPRTLFASSRPVTQPDEGYTDPAPELGRSVLKLEVRTQIKTDASGKDLPVRTELERTFLSVDSPAVKLPPGTLVRISAWIKVPAAIQGDAAGGVLFYDNAGGEPLSVRILAGARWKQYHLYRRVPANGQIAVTLALTGTGRAFFDDVRIEPLVAGAASAKSVFGPRSPVIPASYTRP
jgi:hypothetical protein